MKTFAYSLGLAVLLLGICCGWAQDAQRSAPKVPQPAPPVSSLEAAKPSAAPATAQGEAIVFSELRGIAVFDNYEQAQTRSLRGIEGVRVLGPRFLRNREFEQMIGRFLYRPIGESGIREIWTNVVEFCRQQGRADVEVMFPDRTLDAPVIPIAVVRSAVAKLPEAAPAPKPPSAERPPPTEKAPVRPVFDADWMKLITAEAWITNLAAIAVFDDYYRAKSNDLTGIVGAKVFGPKFLQNRDFERLLQRYLGQRIGENGIRDLQTNVVLFCRKQGHDIVDVVYPPEQEVTSGVLRIAVVEGKLDKLNVVVNGRTNDVRDTKSIERQLRLKPGGLLVPRQLVDGINWLQRINPFREITNANLRQTKEYIKGTTDYELQIQERYPVEFRGRDRWPLRGYAGYENSGNEILGEDRLVAGFNAVKLWGLDHQMNFQFASDFEFQKMQSYAASYVAPLPWRHLVTLYGSYADLNPDLETAGLSDDFEQPGQTYQGSLRYAALLPRFRNYFHEVGVGFDFKSSDSDLEFGGTKVVSTPTHIDQFTLEYRGLLRDRWGMTALDLAGFYSPGDLTEYNKDEYFEALRMGAEANYYYARGRVERATKLPLTRGWGDTGDLRDCFVFAVRGTFQYAADPLLPSETLGLTGYDAVRGYEERLINGDAGWYLNAEIRSPAFRVSRWLERQEGVRVQLLAFYDYGMAYDKAPLEGQPEDYTVSSVGAGVRLNVGRMLGVRCDFGYRLDEPLPDLDDYRFHISALLSF